MSYKDLLMIFDGKVLKNFFLKWFVLQKIKNAYVQDTWNVDEDRKKSADAFSRYSLRRTPLG